MVKKTKTRLQCHTRWREETFGSILCSGTQKGIHYMGIKIFNSLPHLFNLNTQVHQHDTRTKNDIHLPSIHLTKVKKGPYFSCIQMFNHLPERIISLDPMQRMHKKILQTFFWSHPFYSIHEYLEYKEWVIHFPATHALFFFLYIVF